MEKLTPKDPSPNCAVPKKAAQIPGLATKGPERKLPEAILEGDIQRRPLPRMLGEG